MNNEQSAMNNEQWVMSNEQLKQARSSHGIDH